MFLVRNVALCKDYFGCVLSVAVNAFVLITKIPCGILVERVGRSVRVPGASAERYDKVDREA